MSRKRAVALNGVLVLVLSLPCALGFNILSGVAIPGIGDIQSIEDFIVSNNMLPLGSLIFLLFCVTKRGWGWENFLAEADAGQGVKFPAWSKPWLKYRGSGAHHRHLHHGVRPESRALARHGVTQPVKLAAERRSRLLQLTALNASTSVKRQGSPLAPPQMKTESGSH